jgi:hypothetical protein
MIFLMGKKSNPGLCIVFIEFNFNLVFINIKIT